MPVHAQSVISTWLNGYDPTFYTAITNQENSAYNQVSGVANWQGLFNYLDGSMTGYKVTSRYSNLVDYMPILYSYRVFNLMYGTDGSLLSSADALTLFSMNGFTTTAKGRATNYYNDVGVGIGTGAVLTANISGGAVTSLNIVSGGVDYDAGAGVYIAIHGGGGEGAFAIVTAQDPVTFEITATSIVRGGSGYSSAPTVTVSHVGSAKLSTDYTAVINSISPENATIAALQSPMIAAYKPKTSALLFDSPTPLASADKTTMKNYIFLTLHYKSVFTYLPVSPLVLPPGV